MFLQAQGNTEITNIYLIDLENKPFFKKENNFKEGSIYIGFLNSIHHTVKKYKSWRMCQTDQLDKEIKSSTTNKLLYVVDGGTADLVDHFMTAFIYPVLKYIKDTNIKPTIYIISGDHAGWCTRTCFEKVMKWNSFQLNIINDTDIQ